MQFAGSRYATTCSSRPWPGSPTALSASSARNGRRARRLRDGHLQLPALRQRQDEAPRQPRRRGRSRSRCRSPAPTRHDGEAARYNVDHGAQIIDINMGCPAKKVCNVMAGSALLQDEPLVGRILDAVVRPSPCPVTLKIRTGWDKRQSNALAIARIAEAPASARSPSTAARAPDRLHRARPSTTPSPRSKAGAHPGHRQRRHRLAGKGEGRCSMPPAPTA
jgi:hypothetical protein